MQTLKYRITDTNIMAKCEMKGFLKLLIMWLVSQKPMTGSEIANELERRKGTKPSPGTIYPALKELKNKGLLSIDDEKRYTLTDKGNKELHEHVHAFFQTFCDIDKMRHCCGKHHKP